MTITHYNIKQQRTCFQGTETQSNTQSRKHLQNWQFPGSPKVANTLFLLGNRAQAFSVRLTVSVHRKHWGMHPLSTTHTTSRSPRPRPLSPTVWKTISLPLEPPWMGTWGQFYPPAGCVQGLTLPLHRVSPTVLAWPLWGSTSRWLPENQHHLCKSPSWSPQKRCSNSLCQQRERPIS